MHSYSLPKGELLGARSNYVSALVQQIRTCEDDQQIRVFRIRYFIAIKTTVTLGTVWYLSPLETHKASTPSSTNIHKSQHIQPHLKVLGWSILLDAFPTAPMHDFLIISLPIIAMIRNTDIRNLISDLHPDIARSRDGADLAKYPVCDAGNQESSKEVEIVDALGSNGNLAANGTGETNHVDGDTCNVSGVTAPVETEGVVVWTSFLARVKILNLEEALTHNVVVADHDACNRGEKDGVCGEIGGEAVGVGEEVPWAHDETDKRTNVTAASNADPAWRKSRHVSAGGD